MKETTKHRVKGKVTAVEVATQGQLEGTDAVLVNPEGVNAYVCSNVKVML